MDKGRLKNAKPGYVVIIPWNLKKRGHTADRIYKATGQEIRDGGTAVGGGMTSRIHYTKPSITELEVGYATDAARTVQKEILPNTIHCFYDTWLHH